MSLSKTVQLGVIILGQELLRQLKVPVPRIISAAARELGVSRKAGYEALERVRRQLDAQPQQDCDAAGQERQLALLEIRVQALTYERDHRVRFGQSAHLPAKARSLCVRLLRDFRAQLKCEEIAEAIGVPASSLRRWEKEANERCEFPNKDDGRGKHRHCREEDERRVLEAWGELQEPITLAQFAALYRDKHPERPLDPKTIQRILQQHGLQPLKAKERSPPYHGKVGVYFPGAQVAVDATECQVRFVGQRGEETVKLKEEVAIDIDSGTILGKALRKEEDAEGVERVIVSARRECEQLLAVLADNRSANRSAKVRRVIEEQAGVGATFSFPYHARTNGHIEGLFGWVKRIVGKIEIDDSSRQSMARSLLRVIWRIYEHFNNYAPRRRLGGLSPIEYLRRYAPLPEEVEAARRDLRRRRERSEQLRRPNPRLHDEEFRQLVERIVREHRFEVDLDRALKSLLPYDTEVIGSASHAFFVASSRDSFQEEKRVFAYFMGIVRNKQRELDEGRLRSRLEQEELRREIERDRRKRSELAMEREQEREDLREHPERVVLSAAKLLLSGGMRLMMQTFLKQLRAGLAALERLGGNTNRRIEQLALQIRSWGEYREGLKAEMVELLEREATAMRERGSKTSTC